MGDETLDAYRLTQAEERGFRNSREIRQLEEKTDDRFTELEQREAVRDVKVEALQRSNNRYVGAFVALGVAVVGSATAIIFAGGHP